MRYRTSATVLALALAFYNGREPKRAWAAYTRAIELSGPNFAPFDALLGRAAVAINAGTHAGEALADLERAALLAPDHVEVFFYRGTLLEQLGRREEATESWRRAARINPEFVRSMVHMLMRTSPALARRVMDALR